MKGVRFYTDGPGSVVAILLPEGKVEEDYFAFTGRYMGVSGVYRCPNSPCATTEVAVEYLRESCKRISEKKAREIHPRLFEHPAMQKDEEEELK